MFPSHMFTKQGCPEVISHAAEEKVRITGTFRLTGRTESWERSRTMQHASSPPVSQRKLVHTVTSEYLLPELSLNRDDSNRKFNFRNSF